jgi:hypothetical protein
MEDQPLGLERDALSFGVSATLRLSAHETIVPLCVNSNGGKQIKGQLKWHLSAVSLEIVAASANCASCVRE